MPLDNMSHPCSLDRGVEEVAMFVQLYGIMGNPTPAHPEQLGGQTAGQPVKQGDDQSRVHLLL